MRLTRSVTWRLRRLLGLREAQGYSFRPAQSIRSQAMTFRFRDRELRVLAGYSTPLYETIAEVVDYDCYQLGELHPDALRDTTLVDIGANVGVTTLCLAQFPQTRVLSFEPDPDNCARLEANVRENGASNVTVVGQAVSRRPGTGRLARPAHEDVGCRLLIGVDVSTTEHVIEVPTTDLAGVLGRVSGAIGLAKIDCEGAEHDIVDQISPADARRLPRLTLEVHDQGKGRNCASLSDRLARLGYRLSFRPDPFGRPSLTHVLALRGVA